MYTLYGDGIHDDTAAIQELIDNAGGTLELPEPENFYLISKTLILPSGFKLSLPRNATIRLADGSNCFMAMNKTVYKPEHRTNPEIYARRANLGEEGKKRIRAYTFFVNDYSPDPEDATRDVEISGGIWDFNNMGQNPNPQASGVYEPYGFVGYGMLFYNVDGLKLSNLTLKDPINFAVTLDRVCHFDVRDIVFDFNLGNPIPLNMDGIHVNGHCHYGVIENLSGTTYDDLVALNADEGSFGPITDIKIRGLSAENCHSAVRLLTVKNVVENIEISDVYGSYYQYCIGLTHFYPGETEGYFGNISIRGVNASKADREPIRKLVNTCKPTWGTGFVYPFIWVQKKSYVKNLEVKNVYRCEKTINTETVVVDEGATVENMTLENIKAENHTGAPLALIRNDGVIKSLSAAGLCAGEDEILIGKGTIEQGAL